jgi:thymidylate kinase
MGIHNILIEGLSGSGKTSVAEELQRRGFQVVHGDRELAYKGDPGTGEPVSEPVGDLMSEIAFRHRHHIWDVKKLSALVADKSRPITFFCGGARNSGAFIDLFDRTIVLEVDRATLMRRLALRDPSEFGGRPEERAFIAMLHETREDLPTNATAVDASAPLAQVVETILALCSEGNSAGS